MKETYAHLESHFGNHRQGSGQAHQASDSDSAYQSVRLRAAQQPRDEIADQDAAKQGDYIRPGIRMSRISLQFFRRDASARLPGCFEGCEPDRSEDPVSDACQYNCSPIYSHDLTLRAIRRDDTLFRRLAQSNYCGPHIFSTCCGLHPCSRSLFRLSASWRLASRRPASSRTRSQW